MFSAKYYYPHFIASVMDIQGQCQFLLINGTSNMCMVKKKLIHLFFPYYGKSVCDKKEFCT